MWKARTPSDPTIKHQKSNKNQQKEGINEGESSSLKNSVVSSEKTIVKTEAVNKSLNLMAEFYNL